MKDTAKQASEQVWKLAVDELYGEIHPNADNVLPKVQAIIEQALQIETAALREELAMARTAKQASESSPALQFARKVILLEAENTTLRAEVEQLRSLVTRALILAGGYSTEQRRFWNELIEAGEAALREGQKGSE